MDATKWSERAEALRAAPAEPGPRREQVSMRLPTDVIAEIARLAEKERRSRTAMTELLLVEAISQRETRNEVFG